ncbi:hypothetical protein BKA69DRAFT_1122313 [Paraphysoderma sedebokerense]|nr:hypothetical protein BKA69DRAFT_1122313 [Paraphysoderma sedebokerense]
MARRFNPEEATTIAIIALTMAVLSIFGSIYIIISYIYLKKNQRHVTTKMVFYLSCLDLFSSTWIVIMSALKLGKQISTFNALCSFQGWVQLFFYGCTNFWSLAFAIQLYLQIVRRKAISGKRWIMTHILVWVPNLLISLVPLVFTSWTTFGDSGPVCFIRDPVARQILYYAPVYAIIVSIVILYALIIYHIHSSAARVQSATRSRMSHRRTFFKLGLYPAVFLMIWIPNSINRLYEAVTLDISFALTILQTLLLPSQGFLNCVVYGLSSGRFSPEKLTSNSANSGHNNSAPSRPSQQSKLQPNKIKQLTSANAKLSQSKVNLLLSTFPTASQVTLTSPFRQIEIVSLGSDIGSKSFGSLSNLSDFDENDGGNGNPGTAKSVKSMRSYKSLKSFKSFQSLRSTVNDKTMNEKTEEIDQSEAVDCIEVEMEMMNRNEDAADDIVEEEINTGDKIV